MSGYGGKACWTLEHTGFLPPFLLGGGASVDCVLACSSSEAGDSSVDEGVNSRGCSATVVSSDIFTGVIPR
jgi:hypothetical protein